MKKIYYIVFFAVIQFGLLGCGLYHFTDASIPPNVKTIAFIKFENRANYINPQLAATLTQDLVSMTTQQTRLSVLNSNQADWVVTGVITDYSVTTSVTTNAPANSQQPGAQQAAQNSLNVSVQITLTDNTTQETKDYTASANQTFPATQTLQQAESALLPDLVNILTKSIFNSLFSNW